MIDFKWYFFVCSKLQSSYLLVAPLPGQPTVLYVSVISWPVKWFIEWLSQYIAPGRLCPWSPQDTHLLPLVSVPSLTQTGFPFGNILSLICDLACSNLWRLLGLHFPCFTCWICRSMLNKSCATLSNCLFNSAREGPPPCAIVLKKVTRLTPVCQQAFDVVNIWVKVNIRSRSTQVQDPLNWSDESNKVSLVPTLEAGNFCVFVWHGLLH